ncbi:MAG TPA: anti-sigma factor [Methylovirgula sp.]
MTEEIETQAAEYVLGTLAVTERAGFEVLLATNPEAQRAVSAWERRLTPLAALVDDVPPSPAVWESIQQRLPGSSQSQTSAPIILALRKSRDRWRFGAVIGTAIAAGLAISAVDRVLPQQKQPAGAYVAVVNRGGQLPALIVRVDLSTNSVFVRPVATEVPQGHSLELWYIGQGKSPKSMGLVDKQTKTIPLPAGVHIEKADFAVTVEPEGGSPTGGPTGPVVYSGQLLKE